jgi:NAD(P)-dependent dehydrogenase (short-subunit alcohol dehydrogenase family)
MLILRVYSGSSCYLGPRGHSIPYILKSGGESVINTASFVAVMGAGNHQIAYTACKGAVLSKTSEMAIIYARWGIRFNSLCPSSSYDGLDEDLGSKLLNSTALEVNAEVASIVAYLKPACSTKGNIHLMRLFAILFPLN